MPKKNQEQTPAQGSTVWLGDMGDGTKAPENSDTARLTGQNRCQPNPSSPKQALTLGVSGSIPQNL